MTYAVRQETDGSFTVLADGYVIKTGLTSAEASALLDYLRRLEAEAANK